MIKTKQAQALLNIVLVFSFAFIIYIAIDINKKVDRLIEVYIALEEYEGNYREARLELLKRAEKSFKEQNYRNTY
jgi:hypothetical protein